MSLSQRAKEAMKELGINPNKLRGQNFCIEPGVIKNMVEKAGLNQAEMVLEIGPGLGFLTEQLLTNGHEVIAVEIEQHFIDILHRLEQQEKLTVLHADALTVPLDKYLNKEYSVVSNLPYSITGSIIRRLLTAKPLPRRITVLLQREVAERMIAPAGEMSLLSLAVQLYSQAKIVRHVSAKAFWPVPKVESSIIQMDNVGLVNKLSDNQEKLLWQIAKFGFASKRKQLHNNIASGLRCENQAIKNFIIKIGLDEKTRAQQLSVKDWIDLTFLVEDYLKNTQTSKK